MRAVEDESPDSQGVSGNQRVGWAYFGSGEPIFLIFSTCLPQMTDSAALGAGFLGLISTFMSWRIAAISI